MSYYNCECRSEECSCATIHIKDLEDHITYLDKRIKELEFKLDGANGALKEMLKANKQVDQALAKLRDKQHSLDPEAQRILNDNFWDLVGE